MFIPQFSIRWLLGITGACALLSWLASLALTGAGGAALLAVCTATVCFILLIQSLVYAVVWALSKAMPTLQPREADPAASEANQ